MHPAALIDIIEPAPPAPVAAQSHWLAGSLLLMGMLLVLGGVLWWRCRGRRAARRRMRQLRQQHTSGALDAHAVGHQIAEVLRRHLRIPQLQAAVIPVRLPAKAQPHWAALLIQLDRLRYQSEITLSEAQWAQLWTQLALCLARCG